MVTDRRVELLPADDPRWAGDLRHYVVDGAPMAIFAALAGSDRALADLRSATTACLTSPLPVRFRELVILRICAATGCWNEWDTHLALFAARADVSQADLDALRTDPGPDREPSDHIAVALADAVVAGPQLSDATWRRLDDLLGTELALDSLMVAGQYLKVVWLTNALGLNSPRP